MWLVFGIADREIKHRVALHTQHPCWSIRSFIIIIIGSFGDIFRQIYEIGWVEFNEVETWNTKQQIIQFTPFVNGTACNRSRWQSGSFETCSRNSSRDKILVGVVGCVQCMNIVRIQYKMRKCHGHEDTRRPSSSVDRLIDTMWCDNRPHPSMLCLFRFFVSAFSY